MTAAPLGPIDMHALWCDDIRHEIGNKPSFMGVYTSALGVPQLPLALPKLCCWLTLTAPPELPLTELTVTINLDDGTELLRVPCLPQALRIRHRSPQARPPLWRQPDNKSWWRWRSRRSPCRPVLRR